LILAGDSYAEIHNLVLKIASIDFIEKKIVMISMIYNQGGDIVKNNE